MEPSPNRSSCWSALFRLKGRHGLPSYTPQSQTLEVPKWTQPASCVPSSPTSLHIFNGSPEAPNQGRLSWHHDSILNCLNFFMSKQVSATTTIFADLPNHCARENRQGTILVDLFVSTA